MALDWSHITPENLASLNVDGLIAASDSRKCDMYASLLSAARTDGKPWTEAQLCCLDFVQAVLVMMLCPGEPSAPFGPVFQFEDPRGLIPSDLPRDAVRSLHPWAKELRDPELRARFLDVVWLQGREYQAAREAVSAYLESAKILEHPEHWSSGFKRLERGVRLSATLGRGGEDLKELALKEAQDMLRRHGGRDPLFLSLSLIRLLLEFRYGDTSRNALVARLAANSAEAAQDYFRAQQYHAVAAACHSQAGEKELEAESLRNGAEALSKEAEKALQDNRGSLAAASIMSDAVEAMRQAPGGKQRADELHARLLEIQPLALEGMQRISTSTDSTELVNAAIAAVSEKPFREAVEALCGMAKPPSLSSLKEQVRQQAQVAVIGSLMSCDIVNGRGRVVAIAPGLMHAKDDISDPALRWRMFQCARLGRGISVQAMINPARRVITAAHVPNRDDILDLIRYSPWIPQGHHESMARALVAGFHADMFLVAHMVPPQVEALIRQAVEHAGGKTATLEPGGVQKEAPLNSLLETPEAAMLLGNAGVFELQDLFVDPLGSNIRNEVAHGLMPDVSMFGPDVLYAWWLLLKFCVLTSKRAEFLTTRQAGSGTSDLSSDKERADGASPNA